MLRTGPYFIFECQNLLDRDVLVHTHTTVMDGKPITFRASSDNQIPTSLRFNMASILDQGPGPPMAVFGGGLDAPPS